MSEKMPKEVWIDIETEAEDQEVYINSDGGGTRYIRADLSPPVYFGMDFGREEIATDDEGNVTRRRIPAPPPVELIEDLGEALKDIELTSQQSYVRQLAQEALTKLDAWRKGQ